MAVIIFGAGQIGRVVASVLKASGQTVVGFVDDNAMAGDTVAGLPVLGGRDALAAHKDARVCIGVGTINARRAVADWLDQQGIITISAIHPSAMISDEVTIGRNTVIGAGCVFYGDVQISEGCYFGPSVTVSHDSVVGAYCLLSVGSVIGARVDIANHVFVGTASTLMEPGFGAEARLQVGAGAIVGAGALVIRDVAPQTTVIGRPAKKLDKPTT